MSIVARAITHRRLAKESATMALLRSNLAPIILSFIAEHFPPSTPQRSQAEIYELFGAEIKMLRAEDFDLPKGPQSYINDWVKAGWLIRKPGTSKTGETLEPSEAALSALETAERWSSPRSTVTASRIQAIAQALQMLARDSDPDSASRLTQLQQQRDQLNALIQATEQGYFEPLGTFHIRERITDILDLAATIPTDFARVRSQIEDINRTLRRQLLDPDATRGDVLEEVFRGVDLIAESEAGQSFLGFYDLLLDREQSAHIDAWIDAILGREASQSIDEELKTKLRTLFRSIQAAGFEVNTVMTSLARSLRDYVRTQDFAENRRMIELLRETRAIAAKAVQQAQLSPISHLDTPLTKIGMSVGSITALKLKNPGEEFVDVNPTRLTETQLDTSALLESVRASEIDFAELKTQVHNLLEETSSASISEVLTAYPATQGLASVVGLIYLAMTAGTPLGREEKVTWSTDNGDVSAIITGWQFHRELDTRKDLR